MFKSLISSLKILTIATAMIAICNSNLNFSTMNLKRTIKTEMVLIISLSKEKKSRLISLNGDGNDFTDLIGAIENDTTFFNIK